MDGQTTNQGADWGELGETLIVCGEMFRGRSDLDVINEGTEYTKQIAAARTAQLDAIRNNLRALSRSLESSKAASQRPQDIPTKQQHARQIETLDQKQYAAAKSIRKCQTELDDKTADVTRIKDETLLWEMKDPIGEHEVDSIAIRAQIWNAMGFELRRGKDGSGDKVLIRTQSGDLRLFPLSERATPAETNELWNINAN